ncbi:hypothetical protein GF376_03385 [Candidatus Peregrinibacteria bacterium]|nr:hypothetical protein [Candidatus Peregrinibacteria bacterium]
MDKQEIKNILESLRFSKGFRNLPNDQQAVIKVSILGRNQRIINQIQTLLNQERQGLAFDTEIVRLVVNQALHVDTPQHVAEYKEALSKQQDDLFLDKLMDQFNEE